LNTIKFIQLNIRNLSDFSSGQTNFRPDIYTIGASIQEEFSRGVRETAGSPGATVAVGNIGLDVKNWGPIHQVRTAHMEDGA